MNIRQEEAEIHMYVSHEMFLCVAQLRGGLVFS